MSKHLLREIEQLKEKLLRLGNRVEDSLQMAVSAVLKPDAQLAQLVREKDDEIDKMEVELEEDCLKVLALYQPVATDLRFIVTILKINNDLERIGDLAVNIAGRAEFLARQEKVIIPYNLPAMAEEVRSMLERSLISLVNLDLELANQVGAADDTVDNMNRETYQKVMALVRQDLNQLESAINLLSVSRYLERIADHATNIAQDVIYLLEGEIVRHRRPPHPLFPGRVAR